VTDVRPAYQGELMLAGWTDSHTAGAKVYFWLPDVESLDAFRFLTVKKGRTAGQRFMAVLVQIGDDEQPVEPSEDRSQREGHALAKSAALICKSDAFQDFVSAALGWQPAKPEEREEQAADFVRQRCRVESRSELDRSPTAAQLFARLMAEFRDWQAAN
jgi:hypothetical protein